MEVPEGLDGAAAIAAGIAALRAFYREMGMPVTLSELGAADAPLEELAKHAVVKGPLGHYVPLSAEDVLAVYRLAQ